MSFVAVAVAGGVAAAGIGGSLISSSAQSSAANSAANAQEQSAQLAAQVQQQALSQQQAQFEQVQGNLSPFISYGAPALNAQENLLGLNGNAAQQSAVNGIENGAVYQGLNQQGQQAILRNAAATGGLRGGNTQAALAQFSPNLLNSLITQQMGYLGSLGNLGENAAAGVGQLSSQNSAQQLQGATTLGNILQQGGAAAAGDYLAQGQATSNAVNGSFNSLLGGLGLFSGLGGFNSGTSLLGGSNAFSSGVMM
jgi:hypothetical protein